MLTPFCWERYDGKPLVLCGPFARAWPVLLACEGHKVPTILLCNLFSDGQSYEALLARARSEASPDRERQLAVLERLPVRTVGPKRLPAHRDYFPILVGKNGVNAYLKALGASDLSALYSATPILTDGFFKTDSFTYFSSFLEKRKNGLYLGSAELVLTARCNLRCRHCANLMPCYPHPEDVPQEVLTAGLQRFLDAVDGVGTLRLLGGEPLLAQQNLRKALEVLARPENRKVLGLQIVTNGALLFQPETLRALRANPLATVYISAYAFLAPRTGALVRQLKEWHIPYVLSGDGFWQDYGAPDVPCGTPAQAAQRFARCRLKISCNTLLNGFLYTCPRQAHGAALGLYPPRPRVDLRQSDTQMLRDEICALHSRREPVAACRCCRAEDAARIARAEQ